MKRLLICTGLLFAATARFACPAKGAASQPAGKATAAIAGKTITIDYCSPRVKGREGHIFTKDGLISHDTSHYPVWRGGANAATTLDTDADLHDWRSERADRNLHAVRRHLRSGATGR